MFKFLYSNNFPNHFPFLSQSRWCLCLCGLFVLKSVGFMWECMDVFPTNVLVIVSSKRLRVHQTPKLSFQISLVSIPLCVLTLQYHLIKKLIIRLTVDIWIENEFKWKGIGQNGFGKLFWNSSMYKDRYKMYHYIMQMRIRKYILLIIFSKYVSIRYVGKVYSKYVAR